MVLMKRMKDGEVVRHGALLCDCALARFWQGVILV
jgi:hypothetical protein